MPVPAAIWSMIPPTADPTTGRAFPHALGHGQPEPFGEAFLRDDGGVPLQRVDHRGVFADVIERQGDQQDPGAGRGRQITPLQQAIPEYRSALGVIGHPGDRRAGQHEVSAAAGATYSAKPPITPDMSLSRSHRET